MCYVLLPDQYSEQLPHLEPGVTAIVNQKYGYRHLSTRLMLGAVNQTDQLLHQQGQVLTPQELNTNTQNSILWPRSIASVDNLSKVYSRMHSDAATSDG